MKTKKYVKTAVAGVSAFAIGAVSMIPPTPVMAAGQMNEAKESAAAAGEELTKETIAANDNVLYIANCGTSDPTVVPNANTTCMGLLQSSVDQNYGEDPETGRTWGLSPDTEYSIAKKHADNATDIGYSFVYMGTEAKFDKYKSTLGYDFEVFDENEKIDGIKSDTYEVTVAFKHYWDERWLNISLEGKTVATDLYVGYDSWVSRTFTTEVTDGELNVDVSSPRRWSTNQDPIINFIKIRAVEDKEKEVPTYDSISGTAGAVRYDTNGNQIQAHGGQIQKLTVDGVEKYYWIGEDKTNDYRPVGGIHVYSSADLYNWDDEGVVLQTMENPDQFENDPYFKNLYGDLSKEEQDAIFVDLDKNNAVMERPKMLYNDKTGKYVIWFHADGRTPGNDADYGKAKAGVAIADSPTGPFKLLGSNKLYHAGGNYGYDGWENRGSVRDMNMWHIKDDDGQAYVIYSSEGNQTTYIAKLNEEYTGLATENRDEGVEGVHFTRNFAGWSREAPAMFKYKDKYYMINSGCTGWSPNRADYAVADNPLGPWNSKGDPCTDWGSDTTYQTQSTCVFPVDAEKGQYIYMGDRWNSGDLSESRYVWIPVEFQEGDKIALRRYDNWTLDALNDKGTYDVVTELPKTAASAEELIAALPETVTMSNGTTSKEYTVTWETDKLTPETIGEVTVKGKLDNKETVSLEVQIVNPNTVYFFDSYATESAYFDAVKKAAGDKLLNTQPDQKYSEETKAGYTSVLESEDSKNFDMGTHGGGDMWGTGYWAESGKTIDYAFTLKPGTYSLAAGFQEWWADWADSRDMKITISQNDQVLAEKDCSVKDNTIQTAQEFTVEEEGLVKVCISKTGGSDQVLSWIGVIEKTSKNPDEEKADKTSLNHAILMAEKMEKEQEENKCYTEKSWAKVAEALKAAREIAENKEVDQKAIDEAFLNLITACSTVENAAQKVGLKAAIEGAEAILADAKNLSQYIEESVAAVRTALEEAKTVFNSEAADQGTINNATTKLLTTVNAMLLEKEEEDTRLDILIQMAETLLKDKDQYTASSVDALEKALEAAKDVANRENATEAEINEAYNTLAETMTSLARKANKDELKNALDKANAILANKDNYTESSLGGLEDAKNAAQTVCDKDDATQDEVGEALKKLITEILEARLKGDVNLNGVVDSEDAADVLRYNAELKDLSAEQLDAADVNDDAAADSSDAGMILQYAAEKISEF